MSPADDNGQSRTLASGATTGSVGRRQAAGPFSSRSGHSPARDPLELHDGSRVAIVGGGPAGSFFAYFLLETAQRAGLDLDVTVFEQRDFTRAGPAGCNMCAGVLSESMVQVLATEGIRIPRDVAQRGLDAYVIHSPDGRVYMDLPLNERRITAMHRGSGPKNADHHDWKSFDGFLLGQAEARGATVAYRRVKTVTLEDGYPYVETDQERSGPYELVAMCTGVNSPITKSLAELGIGFSPPTTSRTYVAELRAGKDWVDSHYGSAMHVFMLNIPRIEFGGLLPKGRYVTLVLVGDDIDDDLVDVFLSHPEVRRCLPPHWTRESIDCSCRPRMSIKGAPLPYADRFVFIGDAGVTRLYKDGIGAAYRGAKAAAVTAVFDGVSAECFAGHFKRTCEIMRRDNSYGRLVFRAAGVVQALPPFRRGMLRMVSDEQRRPEGERRFMSEVLWDTFTGSAPYRQVFFRALHPAYLGGLLWRSALGLDAPHDERQETMSDSSVGKTYHDGEVIVREGTPGDCMFVVLAGRAEVLTGPDGSETSVAVLQAGDFFGEMALFDGEVRSATVRALGEVRMLTVDRRTLLGRIHEDPSLAVKMLEKMSGRIRNLDALVERLHAESSQQWEVQRTVRS